MFDSKLLSYYATTHNELGIAIKVLNNRILHIEGVPAIRMELQQQRENLEKTILSVVLEDEDKSELVSIVDGMREELPF